MAYTEKDRLRHKKWKENNKEKVRAYYREYSKVWRKNNPERRRAIKRKYDLKRAYGMTEDQYNFMLQAQNNCCDICKKESSRTKKLHIDHCHKTGKIRGLLCSNCNTTLGLVKESLEILQSIANYLRKSST